MNTGTALVIVGGVLAVLFFATSKGLISSGAVPVGRGVYAPQPAQNYSGYLAASTAPSVAGALNNVLSGLSTGLGGWLSRKANTPAPAVRAAAPTGEYQAVSTGVGPSNPTGTSDSWDSMLWTDPLAYDNTNQTAFAYDPLALDNAYDPNYSLMTDTSLLPV